MRRAALLATCVLVAACGGGDNRLSRAEYAKRANAICTRYNAKVHSLGTAGDVKGLAELATKTAAALKRARNELRRLSPPKDETATAGRWLASIDVLLRDIAALRDRATANDLAGVRRVVNGARRDDQVANGLARTLGATVCTQPY